MAGALSLAVAIGVLIAGDPLKWLLAAVGLVAILAVLSPFLVAVWMVLGIGWLVLRGAARPVARLVRGRPAVGVSWRDARGRFDRLRTEYVAHECDPVAVLRLPALTDVRVESTARFVDAFAQAQALDTDQRPGKEHARTYVAAVERACQAWQAARDAAERLRWAGLSPAERASVQRVIKLLTVAADSGQEAERVIAYGKAREELARLERTGVIQLPRAARVAVEQAARGRLPA